MIYFVTNLFTTQGYQPTIRRCAPQPGRPPRVRPSFGRPCRCAREAGAHAAGARARGRARLRAMSAPVPARLRKLRARREARRHLRWLSARARAPPCLFCLTACALLPLVQAAADASGRARRPPRPRHLRRDRQARRRHHGHEDPAAITPAGSAAWPSRREACSCEACACDPGAVFLEAAAPSAHCSTRSPSEYGPVDSVLVIGAMTATASTTAASSVHDPPPVHLSRRLWRRR